jgi:Family of unknown function (DUF6992)
MPFMWADTLLAAERAHLLRLVLWGGVSLLLGTALIAAFRVRGQRSPLLESFALVTAGWGAVDLGLALWGMRSLAVRDLAGATRLDRFLWLNVGLDVGYVMVGVTLLVVGWRMTRRAGPIGAGFSVIVQGLALVILDLVLANRISR